MSEIRFGTDGWRAVIAREFTFANVAIVSQAIAAYLREQGLAPRGVLVGYDARFLSEQFAAAVAEVMSSNGIPVWVADRDAPTPALAFHVLHRKTAGAVMLTASHNPPEYHGIKFIPDYGSPALPEVTDRIERLLRQPQAAPAKAKSALADVASAKADAAPSFDPRPDYLAQLAKVVDLEVIRKARLQVKVDCMHGTARGYLDEILRQAGCEVEVLRGDRNPLFGGAQPDPSEANLQNLASRVVSDSAHLGLAADGDGDRFGVIDPSGGYLSPNQVIALVAWQVRKTRYATGSLARTVATTHLVDAIAAHFGLGLQETPVGFKYIGKALRETDAIVGGEESGGLSIKGHIPEKDGILAGLLVAEMTAREGRSPLELLEAVQQEVGHFCTRRLDLPLPEERKQALLDGLKSQPPARLAAIAVAKVNLIDGVKLELENGEWLLARPSGTEPLVRVYLEAATPERLAALEAAARELVG